MELILRQDIDGLGKKSDVVVVSDGYGRNYLIPRQLALRPTKANMQQIEREKRQEMARLESELEAMKALAERISQISCTVPVKVGAEGQLYGSVTEKEIADALRHEEIELDPQRIILESPLKELGVYNFKVRLHPEVEATGKVWVVEG